jgi:protocatechuate 3,4-dioxygenase beta subunit
MSKRSFFDSRVTRRCLLSCGVTATGAIVIGSLPSLARETLSFPSADEVVPPEWSKWANECVFTSVAEEGPYWIDDRNFRRDIRDGQQGQDLLLRLQVIDAPRCEPLPDAVVEIWHCNALGYYSGYAGQDPNADPTEITDIVDHLPEQSPERWLRGAQRSDAEGNCEFLTVYPGWYSGRTVHIHLKVHLNSSRLITSQLYFPGCVKTLRLQPVGARTAQPDSRSQFVVRSNLACVLCLVLC